MPNNVEQVYDAPMWRAALEHLETEHPKQLERMLVTKTLRPYLEKLVYAVRQGMSRMSQANPQIQENPVEYLIAEQSLIHQLLEPNPDLDPENPPELSPKGRLLLDKFLMEIDREAEQNLLTNETT